MCASWRVKEREPVKQTRRGRGFSKFANHGQARAGEREKLRGKGRAIRGGGERALQRREVGKRRVEQKRDGRRNARKREYQEAEAAA